MRSAKVIAAAVPTISFGQNLVTEKTEVPQTQSYQGFAGLVVQKLIIPTPFSGVHFCWVLYGSRISIICISVLLPTVLHI